MTTRILTFHNQDTVGNETRIGPTYYIEADYEKVAVRIYAETAPTRDAEIDIFDDGVSIFNSRASTHISLPSGFRTVTSDKTTAVLAGGENSEVDAEDFNDTPIEKGSWIHCNLVDAGGGKNFTVQLELRQVSEDDERED
jgi:hypothetical protein